MIMSQMNGHECFKKLRAIDDAVPAALASGFAQQENIAILKEAGLHSFLRKLYRRNELSRLLKDVL